MASKLVGLSPTSIDAEILRLESILRDGLDPRLTNVRTKPIAVVSGVALVIRVAKSWIPPHRVKYGGTSRFFARNSAGKHELDVSEMRPLFTLSTSATERIRNFRIERLSKITSGEVSLLLRGEHRIVVHVVPFSAFDPLHRFDLGALKLETDRLRPMDVVDRWNGPRHNFDGLYSSAQSDGLCYSYLQLFRTGSAEAVNTSLLRKIKREDRSPERYIDERYQQHVIDTVNNIMSLQKELGVEPPLFIMLSFLGVKDYNVAFSGVAEWGEGHPIDRNDLLLPEEIIESFDANIEPAMQRLFQIVWNAAGYSRPPR